MLPSRTSDIIKLSGGKEGNQLTTEVEKRGAIYRQSWMKNRGASNPGSGKKFYLEEEKNSAFATSALNRVQVEEHFHARWDSVDGRVNKKLRAQAKIQTGDR